MSNDPRFKAFNEGMVRVAEELGSKYAEYPIRYKRWLNVTESVEGSPCFISSNGGDAGLKVDYVFCTRGPLGPGYYHLLTKVAYVNLYGRLQSSSPPSTCLCFGDRKGYNEYVGVKAVVYNRFFGSKPDDVQAKKDAEAAAKEIAQGVYNLTQVEQIILMSVT